MTGLGHYTEKSVVGYGRELQQQLGVVCSRKFNVEYPQLGGFSNAMVQPHSTRRLIFFLDAYNDARQKKLDACTMHLTIGR